MVFRSDEHSILKGSDSDTNMINVLDKINIKDVNYLTKSNKHRKYFTGDAGYDSNSNRAYLNNKGYTDIIWSNKRNTKDKDILKKRKIKGNHKDKYKKRHIVENYFSWMDIKIPRLVRLYDKKIKSYLSMIHISAISLIIESAFKMDFFLNEHDVLSFIEQYIKFVSRRI